MKSVIIIRHAKSSWDFSSSDFARPLNDRGHHDAPVMADRLLNKNIKIDNFISSPANRALTTAEYFFEAFNPLGDKNTGIIKIPELYHAAVSVFLM